MAISKKQANKARQQVRNDDMQVTGTLNSSTPETIDLSLVASTVSFQASGSLAGNVTFSLDGVNYVNSTAIGAANAIVTYTTSLVSHVKVTRTSGSGTLTVVAK